MLSCVSRHADTNGPQGHAPAFAKAGAKAVVLVARNVDRLNALAAELNQLYPKVETLVLSADISDPVKIKGLYEQVNATYVSTIPQEQPSSISSLRPTGRQNSLQIR